MTMALREKLYTADEFFEIAGLPENDEKRLELDDGEIIDMGASSRLNTVTASRINYFLNAHVIPRGLGYVTGADGGFKLARGAFACRIRHLSLSRTVLIWWSRLYDCP